MVQFPNYSHLRFDKLLQILLSFLLLVAFPEKSDFAKRNSPYSNRLDNRLESFPVEVYR